MLNKKNLLIFFGMALVISAAVVTTSAIVKPGHIKQSDSSTIVKPGH